MILPHTPGEACAPGGMFTQRSGLDNITIRASAQCKELVRQDCIPEFLRISTPDAFISVQGKNGDKYPISLGDPNGSQISKK